MIKPEQIPIASMNFYFKSLNEGKSHEECVAAAINAWPGRSITAGLSSLDEFGNRRPVHPMILHLMLSQEKNND